MDGLDKVNERLKAQAIGVTIQDRGGRLVLRAMLPPRPNSTKQAPFQQRLSLGVMANPAGLKRAEIEARKIASALALKEFDWRDYGWKEDEVPAEPEQTPVLPTVAQVREAFEHDYFTRRARTSQSETTWTKDYQAVLSRLDQSASFDATLIRQAVESTKADTRIRQRFVQVLGAVARFADITLDFDLKSLRGDYGPKRLSPRDLPTDLQIVEWFAKIPNPSWQWVYGVLATWGLRPSEAFRILAIEPITQNKQIIGGIAEISAETKKGESRKVWSCYPEWIETFGLLECKLPKVSLEQPNYKIGERVSHQFMRYKIPFQPYDLRHCFAVRTLEFGWDISLAAAQMGHTVAVHSERYHHWISDRHHQKAFNLLMNRPERPRSPELPESV
jgi:integrase